MPNPNEQQPLFIQTLTDAITPRKNELYRWLETPCSPQLKAAIEAELALLTKLIYCAKDVVPDDKPMW